MSSRKVLSELKQGYTVENSSRDLTWLSDEPIQEGGYNKGPKPTELLLSSLTSCMLITMQMYSQRKGWDLKNASIVLEILEHGEKLLLEKRITFVGDLTDEQKKRLTDISGRCPVSKMLSNSIEYKQV